MKRIPSASMWRGYNRAQTAIAAACAPALVMHQMVGEGVSAKTVVRKADEATATPSIAGD